MCKSAMYVLVSTICTPAFAQCRAHRVPALLCAVSQLSKHDPMVFCYMFVW